MKEISFTTILTLLLTISIKAQPYVWELKQPGSSLGGPIDYNRNNTNIVYFGTGNTIYKSNDRGETFKPLSSTVPTASEIKCVLVKDNDDQTLIVAVESSPNDRIYKTTNDGQTWTLTLNSGQMAYLGIPVTQDPTHPDTLYSMIDTSFIVSTDFGSSWTTIASNFGPVDAPCDIEVFPDTSIILIGDDGTGIFKSTDYGITWQQKYSTFGEIPTIAVDFTHPGTAWATKWSESGGLLKSTDYGENWSSVSTFNNFNMWAVHTQETNGNIIITCCFSCGVSWRSVDGGVTWVTIPITPGSYQVVVVDSMTQYAAQNTGFYKLKSNYFVPVELVSFTAKTSDYEIVLQWITSTELNNAGFEIQRSYDNQNFKKIGFVSGYGTTTQPKLYTFKIDQYKSGIQYYRLKQIDNDGTFRYYNSLEINDLAPAKFSLAQNFPNPFNPTTKIKYTIATSHSYHHPVQERDVKVRLIVYDVLGNEVATLADEYKPAGSYEIELDASKYKLGSGVYFYQLNAGDFHEIKKMIFLR